MGRVDGKVAIVTGAASGIGAASARAMAREGASVVVADINGEGIERVVGEIRAQGGEAVGSLTDAGDGKQIEAMVALAVSTYGGLDILHNNAAAMNLVPKDMKLVEIAQEVWDGSIRVNLTGPMLSSKAAIPHMIARGGGSIVHTSTISTWAHDDGYTAYTASKMGLIGLMRSIAVQYGDQGIRSNAFGPGLTLSEHVKGRMSDEHLEIWKHVTPTPWLGEPEDQAAVALFLASDESRFVNGQFLPVDGGLTAFNPVTPSLRAWREGQSRG